MWKSTLVGCPDPVVCPENRLTNVYGFKRLYLHTYIHAVTMKEKTMNLKGVRRPGRDAFQGRKGMENITTL